MPPYDLERPETTTTAWVAAAPEAALDGIEGSVDRCVPSRAVICEGLLGLVLDGLDAWWPSP